MCTYSATLPLTTMSNNNLDLGEFDDGQDDDDDIVPITLPAPGTSPAVLFDVCFSQIDLQFC